MSSSTVRKAECYCIRLNETLQWLPLKASSVVANYLYEWSLIANPTAGIEVDIEMVKIPQESAIDAIQKVPHDPRISKERSYSVPLDSQHVRSRAKSSAK